MAAFVKVASAAEIPEGQLRGLSVGPNRIVVAHTQDGFFAVNDECTHESRPLRTGSIHDGQIMCQAHGARFDLKTGAVMSPPAIVPLDMLETKIEGDDIYVLLED